MFFNKLFRSSKYQIGFSLLLLAFCQCGASKGVPRNTTSIDAMTFNIRLDMASDSLNSWIYRKEALLESVKKYNPDFVGMQEVLHHQLCYINENLQEYTFYGLGRKDGKEEGEYCPIYYKTSKFELLEKGTFALSTTPEIIGSKSWDAAYERITSYVVLKRCVDGVELVVFNTHYDHVGNKARVESSKLLKRKMQEIAEDRPVVLLGDFNVTRKSQAIKTLLKSDIEEARKESRRVLGPDWSFHAFGKINKKDRLLIDHIFVSEEFMVEDYRVIDDVASGKFISDHCPIMVRLYLKDNL